MRASRQFLAKIGHVVCIGGVIVTVMLIGQIPALAASEGANVLFILDGSGSMWGRLENVEKIVIAKKRMTELVQELEGVNMGLIVYGHRRKGDCDDIEMMVPLGSGNQKAIIQKIQSVNPKGKTPIQRSIALAAQHLETLEDETEIVLVSDGLETCDDDPCGYVKTLKDKGIKFTLDVVGFDVKDEEREQLECLANAGGGRYYSAKNAMQLKEAFTEVKKEVVKKVEPQEPLRIYTDDFTVGINKDYWALWTNQNLYTVDDTNHEIRFSKGYGGRHDFQAISLHFLREIRGDFDVRIDFHSASIDQRDGLPGNQIVLTTVFGKQNFSVTRSDEPYHGVTDNIHVWTDPPGGPQWFGTRPNTAASGTLRITREGSRVTGYFNDTVIHVGNYNGSPVLVSLHLNNNGTKDATSVTFDNFYLSCDEMVPLK